MTHPALRKLLLLNAVLFVLLALAWLFGARHWQPPAPVVPDYHLDIALQPSQEPLTAQTLAATLQRPLFQPNRRPVPEDAVQAAEAVPEKDPMQGIKLLGIFEGQGFASILVNAEDKNLRVIRGDKVGPWTVQAIEGRDVTFVHDKGETRTLHLAELKTLGGGPANPPPAAGRAQPAPAQQNMSVAERLRQQRLEAMRRAAERLQQQP